MERGKNVEPLTFERLKSAVGGNVAAIRRVMELEPAGGAADKVFPPTYEGGVYAFEKRLINGEPVETVLLDSVQSQANRIELALLDAHDQGLLDFPVLRVDFKKPFPDLGEITALDAPHRIADAIFRDSLIEGKPFREHEGYGKRYESATVKNATPLLDLCPTALIFGVWDSTGSRGGLGNKFARTCVSEIVGFNCVPGKKTSSRIDPLQIVRQATVFKTKEGSWTPHEEEAEKDEKGNPILFSRKNDKKDKGRPAALNHGNIPPQIADIGGVTISHAWQTAVLSLPALRRLRFPDDNGTPNTETELAARTVLAALALAGIVLQTEEGCDLRSRCLLVPSAPSMVEMVIGGGKEPEAFSLTASEALGIYKMAVSELNRTGKKWPPKLPTLVPQPNLVELVKKSRNLGLEAEE